MTTPTPAVPRKRQPTRSTRLQATLNRCNQAIIRSQNELPLFERLCQELVADNVFRSACIAKRLPDSTQFTQIAAAGTGCAFSTAQDAVSAALSSQTAQWLEDMRCTEHIEPRGKRASRTLSHRCAFLPLFGEGTAMSVLCLQAASRGTFDAKTQDLLLQLSSSITFALDNHARQRLHEQAQAQASQAQRLTQAFIDQLPGTVFLKDAHLRLLKVNRHLAQSLGVEPKALIGRNNEQLFPPDFAQAANVLDRAVLASGTSQTVAQTFMDRHMETRLFVVDDGDGQRLLGGISLDVTDRYNAHQRTQALLALQEMAMRLDERALLTQGRETAERLTLSQIGFLHFVNDDQATLELVTWTDGALRGCTAAQDNHYPISAAGVWADCFHTRAPVVVNDCPELAGKHGLPPGQARLQRFISVPVIEGERVCMILGVGNRTSAYTASDTDTLQLLGNDLWRMTQRRRAENALQQRLRELEEANAKLADMQLHLLQTEKMASIGQLAAGVAHEINNPIGFVRSNLGTLSTYVTDLMAVVEAYETVEANLGPAQSPAFSPVHALKAQTDHSFVLTELPGLIAESQDGIERVRKIVHDLKNFSRSGDTDWQWADLTQGLESTINMVWNQIKYKAELHREFLPLPQVYCVASQINQVVMNLLVNAAQAIEQQGVITVRTGADSNQVWIEVEDTGCGMTADQMKRIFEPFFTTKPPGQGTGLGLSIAWGVMERHHGHIDLHSEPGQGSRFRMRLPIDCRQALGVTVPTDAPLP